MIRVGLGYDIHRLEEGLPLILGGVSIPHSKGCVAHSDGDALSHTITDAILGAAALGNIGQHFPDTDPKYQDSNSLDLLRESHAMLQEAGYSIMNIDSNIIAQQPKLNLHIDAIRASLAGTLEMDVDRISVKAKTNESVGPEGREEAISTQAIVLIQSNA
ncbi:MAG TPA: 2-C-methyl-D-erythritol 2,4-cyclodiphosphate synthase [Candidatus Hydrogenedentes bacterium]|jgi:2-C-methyl-D-erythritol 2,4-cyclodiphosphate synthase|nr:2-C-methyl-D-erythritol 2,4-cyclodiphosphate synthase [Candidatus Hydrogenedentota bacterium]HIB55145.1 2-C-methyl-D-erythritol 2,4-cyclodiphosphate synthase [Nitrospirales bacterium]HIO21849.1 2-C-methyl-D-erythritol 2,4-cyclodiphosphate synthase [Nitrospirales bacterium]